MRGRGGCYTNGLKRASSVPRLLAEIVPEQFLPSLPSWYPIWQEQWRDPGVFEHRCEQPPFWCKHSLISERYTMTGTSYLIFGDFCVTSTQCGTNSLRKFAKFVVKNKFVVFTKLYSKAIYPCKYIPLDFLSHIYCQ